jgi:hypothetical protein
MEIWEWVFLIYIIISRECITDVLYSVHIPQSHNKVLSVVRFFYTVGQWRILAADYVRRLPDFSKMDIVV